MPSGNISSQTFESHRAGLMKPVLVQTVSLDGDGTVWPCGLVMGKGPAGYRPYAETTTPLGTGDGSATDFTEDVKSIEPGSASITDGAVTLTDDGFGNLAGSGGSGFVNYDTGRVAASFTAAPGAGDDVVLTHMPVPSAVLDTETDTAETDSALAVKLGAVKLDELKVGVAVPAAPDQAVLDMLEKHHIHGL